MPFYRVGAVLVLAVNLVARGSSRSFLLKNLDAQILANVKLLDNVRGTNLNLQLRGQGVGVANRLVLSTKLGVLREDLVHSGVIETFENKQQLLDKQQRLKHLSMVSSYRGARLKLNMPVRGQRTHTNAKTRRKRKII